MKRNLKALFGIFASIFFICLVFHSVSYKELVESFRNISPLWIFVAGVALAIAYLLRIKRSQIMLASVKPDVTFVQSTLPFMISVAANNVLPFRAGDAIRVVKFSSWLKISIVSMLAIIFVEHLLDLLSVILAFGVVLLVLPMQENIQESILLHSSSYLMFLIVIIVLVLLLFPKILRNFVQFFLDILAKFSPFLSGKLQPHSDSLFKTLEMASGHSNILHLSGYSVLSWFFEGVAFYAAAFAIPEITNKLAGWLAMPVGTLSTVLPASPGYVGTFHYFVKIATQAVGNTPAAATAYAILIHFILWIPVTIVGTGCFIYWITNRAD